jgi:hypothetical protein
MNTASASTASEYADSLAARIEAEAASPAPFGYVNTYDDNTADTLEEIPDYDPAEHDPENLPENWQMAGGYDYLRNVLDIRFVVNSDRSYRDAEICIGLGGPNVWIHTADRTLNVWWAFESARRELPASYVDALNDAAAELWEMSA